MATDEERAVFNEKMAQWQAYLDRYQATRDSQLILDPNALAEVGSLPDWATGSATWEDSQHVIGWFRWLRYEALGDRRGVADRQVAEKCFHTTSRTRPHDVPESLRQQYDKELQQLYDEVMGVLNQQARRRRPRWQPLQEFVETLCIICNLTSRGHPQYFERLDARAWLAEQCGDRFAQDYKRDALNARTEKGHQPLPANPPWRPFDWTTYFGM